MESKQVSIEEINKVRHVVELITNTDIYNKDRKRHTVLARMMYASLLRSLGYALKTIGKTIDKDHTTIIHYVRTLDGLIETDNTIAKKYIKCKKLLLIEEQTVNLTDCEIEIKILKEQIDILKQENKLLTKEKNELIREHKYDKSKRMAKIFRMIEDNTPMGHELITERKLIKLFDE